MNWGALTGCGLWQVNSSGKLTNISFNQNFTEFNAKCDGTNNTCFEIHQNCDIGKWEIWYAMQGYPSGADKSFYVYWSTILGQPVIEELFDLEVDNSLIDKEEYSKKEN